MDITKLSDQALVDYNNEREVAMQGMVKLGESVYEMLPDAISILDDICRSLEYEIHDQDATRCQMKAAIVMLRQIKG